jgi:hypothetical protein
MVKMLKESAWILILGTIAGIGWYHFYVSPNDDRMNQIMDCMGEDRSKESYSACVKIQGEK